MIAIICKSSCAAGVLVMGVKRDRLVLKRQWRIGNAEAVIEASLNVNDNETYDYALAA
jgi:hypothetical protein